MSLCITPETRRDRTEAPRLSKAEERIGQFSHLSSFAKQMLIYIAFARYAAIIQGVLKRALDGNAANRNMLHTRPRRRVGPSGPAAA